MKKQAGFTLIELVTVIVILGILAAFAVPRFVNLSSDARAATVKGLSGSLHAASALAHAKYIVEGTNPSTITMSGQAVTMKFGYPTGDAAGITASLQDTSGFTPAAATGTVTYTPNGGGTTCQVTYAQSAAANTAPVITPTTTGC